MGGGARVWLLRLLVYAVVAVGVAAVASAVYDLPRLGSPVTFAMVCLLMAAASGCWVRILLRAQHSISVTSLGVLVAVALLPGAWAVVATAVGAVTGKAARRVPPTKVAFNAGKDTVGAFAAVAAVQALGVSPGLGAGTVAAVGLDTALLALVAAAAAYAVVDELLPLPVVSLASGTPWRRVATRALGVRTAGRLSDLAMTVAVVALVAVDPQLLGTAPLAIVATHMVYSRRLRLREERQSWRGLLEATDLLATLPATGDLDRLLRTAAVTARDLFPGTEVELTIGNHRVVASAGGVTTADTGAETARDTGATVKGAAEVKAAAATEDPVTAPGGGDFARERAARERAAREIAVREAVAPVASPLDGETCAEPLGWLRLRFHAHARSRAEWGEREEEQLTGFAAALASAVRTCQAYAAASAAAADHAHHANHDPLTGLANRRRLHGHATDALAARPRRGCVGLLLIDLDHLKQVNDGLGHAAGDRMLVEAATRLRAAAGEHLAARLGGDEFAVLLTGATPTMVTHYAGRIMDALRGPVTIDGVTLPLAASGGIAVAADGQADLPTLLHEADLAMYSVKGSDRPVRLGIPAPRRPHQTPTVDAVARAVDTGELQLRYQPIVALATGRATAATTHLHWGHDDPGDPLAATSQAVLTRHGLLPSVTHTLLDQALAAANSWHRAGFPLQLAVAVAPQQLADPALPATVLARLERASLSPRALLLRLDAHSIAHLTTTADNLGRLHEAGVRLVLDQTATAATPLPVLTRLPLPVDQLHVSCQGIGSATQESAALASLRAMVELGRQLGAAVVACEVGQERQRHLLWQHGCTLAQGTMFGRATSAEQLRSHLQQGLGGSPGILAPPMPAAHHGGHQLRGLRHRIRH